MTSSPSAPNCCSVRSTTPTRPGSASSWRRSGIASLLQVKVGDNVGRIAAVLRDRLADADAVIVTGGLGPTHDDLTRDAIAEVMGVELHLDESVADVIRDLFAARGRSMPENNLRQAMVPDGATVIPQTRGTAPGLICPVGRPGRLRRARRPARDARDAGAGRAARPAAARRGAGRHRQPGAADVGRERERAQRAPRRRDRRLDAAGDPTLAFLARGWEGLEIRLTTRQPTAPSGRPTLLDRWEAEVRSVVGLARVRRRRRLDGVRRARSAARPRAGPWVWPSR